MRELKFNLDVEANALLCPNPTEWFSKSYLTEDVVDNFRVIPGVKDSTKIATTVFDNILKSATCSWAASDTVLDAKTFTVSPVRAMVQICQYDLEKSFVSLAMSKGNSNFEVPAFMAHFYEQFSLEIQEEIQLIRWTGNKSGTTGTYLDEVDGYIVKLEASTSVIGITGSAVDSTNIISTLTTVVNTLPERVKPKKKDVRIYMSATNALYYQIATLGLNNNFNYTGELPLAFAGYKISIQEGMDDSVIVCGNKNSFLYLLDGEGDAKDIKTVNMNDTTVEPIIRSAVGLKIGFDLVNEDEIVYFKA